MSKTKAPFWVLAIDPAKAAGVALLENPTEPKVVKYAAADGSRWKTLHATIEPWLPLIDVKRTVCVIEDGFLTRFANQKSVMTLGRRRGLAQGAAEALGIVNFEHVLPNVWQGALGYKRGSGDPKEYFLEYAAKRYGITGVPNDVTDAIGIGTYYLTKLAKLL